MKQFLKSCLALSAALTMTHLSTQGCAAQTANTLLYGYETDAEIGRWKVVDGSMKKSSDFATEGASSAVLETREWKHGMNEWPVWQIDPVVTDWSPYDRVSIDFTNPTAYSELIRVKAIDVARFNTGSGEWPAVTFTIQPRSHLRAIFPISAWGGNFDYSKIRQMLMYTARAPHDMVLHVDNFTLLRPGQEPSAVPLSFRRQINELRLQKWSLPQTEAALKVVEADIRKGAAGAKSPAQMNTAAWANTSFADLKKALDTVRQKSVSESITTEDISKLGDEADSIARRARRLTSLVQMRTKSAALFAKSPYALGWAGSMQKVLPLDMPVQAEVSRAKTIETARNESEAVQVVVVPFEKALKNCRIEFGAFKGPKGAALPKQSFDSRIVGYVKTRQPAYEVEFVGWWPDPLLDFMKSTDIEPETAQTFWLRLKTPKNQTPGLYNGEVRIVADGVPASTLKLTVKVHDFAMPDRSPMLLANQVSGAEFFNKYSSEDWSTLKYKVTDFLSDYYIDYDNIYRMGPPDFDLLKRLRDKGRLSAYTLATINHTKFHVSMSEEAYQKALAQLFSEIEPGYQTAKKEGILKQAFLYGMDEVPVSEYPMLRRLTTDIKAKYPDLPIMTTAMDYSYGENSGAKDIDIWTPIIHEYSPERAAKLRAAGKKVWWYTCQTPSHPYPNIFTEYPLIDVRLLMGFMAAKMQPDGFLYYCLFRDQGPPRKAITSGPFTDWDACAFIENFNGEGYLAYPGSDGRAPMASIRLENFRDGLEDYAYWKILDATVNQVKSSRGNLPAQRKAWLTKAEALLAVPDTLVKSPPDFTKEPAVLINYRGRIAELLASSGVKPATPVWPELH